MRTDLPSGMVTLVFTDIEGSTRLLHELGSEAYAEALAEHRRLLRGAFEHHGGVEVDTQGDALFCVFAEARDAVAAAEEGCGALRPGHIHVRVGIHTGTPHLSGEGYVGDDVHLGARIGHEEAVEEIQEFLTGMRDSAEPDRAVATVMFVDIVDSTKRAAELGDRRWADVLESFYAVVRRELDRYRGREIDTAGDGFFVTFDGPARAIRCATALREAVGRLGLHIRTGIHTGECERRANKVGGLGVVIGARVGALAAPGEILVSRTVQDLVVGSGLTFEDAGEHELKGVPDRWRLYRVAE